MADGKLVRLAWQVQRLRITLQHRRFTIPCDRLVRLIPHFLFTPFTDLTEIVKKHARTSDLSRFGNPTGPNSLYVCGLGYRVCQGPRNSVRYRQGWRNRESKIFILG